MTTKRKAESCTTHHKACDCREYKFAELIMTAKGAITHACHNCKNTFGTTTLAPNECTKCGVNRLLNHIKEGF